MRLHSFVVWLRGFYLRAYLCALVCSAADQAPNAQQQQALDQAAKLVDQGLRAEVNGQPDQRVALAKQAQQIAPDLRRPIGKPAK